MQQKTRYRATQQKKKLDIFHSIERIKNQDGAERVKDRGTLDDLIKKGYLNGIPWQTKKNSEYQLVSFEIQP